LRAILHTICGRSAKTADETQSRGVIVAENRQVNSPRGGDALDAPVDLAARFGLLVEDNGLQAGTGGSDGRGKTCGACADDREIV
jgi:hypothetical protein